MQFKAPIVAAFFAITAVAAPVPADSEASCAQSAVSALNGATKVFTDLDNTLSKDTDLASLISTIVDGAKDGMDSLTQGTSLPCSASLSQQDQKDICAAADSLVKSEDSLVQTMKTKSGLLTGSDLSPLATILKQLQSDSQNYLEPVVKSSPVCGGEVETSAKALESDINALLSTL